jgi:hypothetical protein
MTNAISGIAALGIPATSNNVKGAAQAGVRAVLRAEGLALMVVAVVLYARSGFSWGLFAALFLSPDLSFAAYGLGPKWGAAAYNFAHSTLAPLALGIISLAVPFPQGEALALIFLAHVGFDRALGYGLKYASSFGDTHLGRIGHAKT